MKNKRINGHGHLLPYPEDIPLFMKKRKLFWVDDNRKYMCQGNWKRPITDPSFFLEEKKIWMAQNNINHEVLITLSQLYCNGLDRETTNDVIRFQNNFQGQVQAENPEEFTCGFVLQPAYIDDALEEMSRCVKELNLKVLCLPTHYINKNGEWISTADESVTPIWQLANDYKLAIEIHPYDAPKMINLKDQYWRFHLIWMCAQTADHYHMFTLFDFPYRFTNLRTCFAHGNQYGQVNIGRRRQGFKGRPDLFENTVDPQKSIGAKNVFFDTLVHDVDSFELLKKRQGISQIIAGLDDPYPLGEMESVPNSYPGQVIDQALSNGVITKEEKNDIWNKNVLNWINP
ncbi:MAG: amidohydrolase family protein [Saprospiraceae bacterium]